MTPTLPRIGACEKCHDSRVVAELDEIAVRLDEAAYSILNYEVGVVDKALHELKLHFFSDLQAIAQTIV